MRHQTMHNWSRLFSQLLGVGVRTLGAGVVFTTGTIMVLRYFGVPMPSPHELLRPFTGLWH